MTTPYEAAVQRLENYKAEIRSMEANEALQVFSLSAVITGTIERNPRLGPIALALASCELAVRLAQPPMDLEVDDAPEC